MQIAICDDNIDELEQIYSQVTAYFAKRAELNVSLRRFQSSYDLADCIQSNKRFDVYFLDVIMPHVDGIQIGELIRRNDAHAAIVYLTSSQDYALRSYGVQAFHYLLKPVGEAQLIAVLERLVENRRVEENSVLPVRTHDGIYAVRFGELMYAEGRSRVYRYYLNGGQVVESVTMRESFDQVMGPLFQDSRFVKANASFVVNMAYAALISGSGFVMRDGRTVSITRGNYAQIKHAFFDFLLSTGRCQDAGQR